MKLLQLFGWLLLSIVAAQPLHAAPIMDRELAKNTIKHTDYGLRYLRTQQAGDGSWANSVAVTAMALHAFSRSYRHYNEDDGPFITRPVRFLLSHVQDDGSISDSAQQAVQNTALAMIALQSLGTSAHDEVIRRAQGYLKKTPLDVIVSGDGAADRQSGLLTLALVTEAMQKTGLDSQAPFWETAVAMVSRLLDRQTATHVAQGEVAAELAALHCLLNTGVAKTDPRVTSLLLHIMEKHPLPRLGVDKLSGDWFDGINTYAKAMRAYGAAWPADSSGRVHNWRNATANALLARRQPDGSWTDARGGNVYPVRETAWSINTLNQVVRSLRD